MTLKQNINKKTGRVHLSMVRSYREPGCKHPKMQTIETFGYVDVLKSQYDDPIAHFTGYVAERNRLEALEAADFTIIAKKDEQLPNGADYRKNYGYSIILKVMAELELETFINRRRQATKLTCNTSAVMRLLVVSRILSPGSKKRAFEEKERYFDFERKDSFDLKDIYRCLSHFSDISKDVQKLIHKRISTRYGRKTDLMYYDCTNYYFEIDLEDELRRKGPGKEHRPNPIVQLGLSMDEEGIPIAYEIFPGNESEKLHLRPMFSELVREYDTGKMIAVADSAQNTGNNIYYLDKARHGYVFSQSIRGGSADFKHYVIDPVGYEWHGDKYMRKSCIRRRDIMVDFARSDGSTYKKKVTVDQRQIIFYSEKYAVRSRLKREQVVKKAQQIIANTTAYTSATSYGALKYVKNVEVNKKTGEIKPSKGKPAFDMDKLLEDEKYDGYYAIVTNLFNEGNHYGKFDDDAIIDIYHGLWRIEDNFRVSKSDLEARPIYLSRKERINAHFLICFICMVIIQLIRKRTDYRHSPAKLIEAMNKISCSNEDGNLYLFDYRSNISDHLGEAFNLDFSKKRLTRSDIKKFLGEAKKA
jgi:transposase